MLLFNREQSPSFGAEAEQGDSLACELLRRQAHHVGLATASLFAILDPARVVPSMLGLLSGDGFGGRLVPGTSSGAQLRKNIRQVDVVERIVSSTLGERARIQGAAALVFADFIERAAFGKQRLSHRQTATFAAGAKRSWSRDVNSAGSAFSWRRARGRRYCR